MKFIYLLLFSFPLSYSQYWNDDDDFKNYLEFTGYNSLEDCLHKNNTIINNTYVSSLDCGCYKKPKCINEIIQTEEFKDIHINFNNKYINIKDLVDDYKCNSYNNLYFSYKLEYNTICPINIIALIISLMITLCIIMCIVGICIEQEKIKKNRTRILIPNIPPPYYEE